MAVNDAETILDSAVAESVSGTISNYNSGSKAKVTIDGADYPPVSYTHLDVYKRQSPHWSMEAPESPPTC